MSDMMGEEIRSLIARRKSALGLETIQDKTTVATTVRQFDLAPAVIKGWVEDGKRDMEGASSN